LESDEFGREYFDGDFDDSAEGIGEATAKACRVAVDAVRTFADDGIVRRVGLEIGQYAGDEGQDRESYSDEQDRKSYAVTTD